MKELYKIIEGFPQYKISKGHMNRVVHNQTWKKEDHIKDNKICHSPKKDECWVNEDCQYCMYYQKKEKIHEKI